MKQDEIYWVWYSKIPGLDNNVKIKLLNDVVSPKEIFRTAGSCLKENNISDDIISKIKAFSTVANIEKFVDLMERHQDIKVVSYYDFDYPRMLCSIHNPPIVIYYIGDISVLHKRCIAVVGTRNSTEKGNYNARSFSRELASAGYTVVSGMAKGIDSSAHIGALSIGNTAAVLGCGVDVVYPSENKELYNKICKYGVVLSEMLPESRPTKWSFPIRNRIISGLSEGVLLVEAPSKSGAMNTVNHALEQDRDVYVFADSSNDSAYSGNRELIDDGATAVTSPYDIINSTGFTAFDSFEKPSKAAEPPADFDYVEPEQKKEKDYSILGEDEMKVLSIIRSGIRQFDEIVLNSESDISSVGFALTMLEFKGFIIQKVGKVYEET